MHFLLKTANFWQFFWIQGTTRIGIGNKKCYKTHKLIRTYKHVDINAMINPRTISPARTAASCHYLCGVAEDQAPEHHQSPNCHQGHPHYGTQLQSHPGPCTHTLKSNISRVCGTTLIHPDQTLSIWLGIQFRQRKGQIKDRKYIFSPACYDSETQGNKELILRLFKVHSLLTYG